MMCPECGAPMRLADGNLTLRCDYCKTVVTAKADASGMEFLDQAPGLQCPTCNAPLWDAVLASTAINACKNCHGMLMAMGEFEPLIARLRTLHEERELSAPLEESVLEHKLNCPKCKRQMDSHFYFGGGHAVMSTCEWDELHWLDGGMLMRIVKAPEPAATRFDE